MSDLTDLVADLQSAPNNIVKLLTALLGSVNDVENVLIALLTERNINTASLGLDISSPDAPLRVVGRIVGATWSGQNEVDYRALCRTQVLVNRSAGVPENLIAIAVAYLRLSTATIVVTNEGAATVRVRVASTVGITDALAAALFALEALAASGGVRLVVQWGDDADVNLFTFDTGPGWDQGELSGALSN